MSPLVIGILALIYVTILWVMVFFVFRKGYQEWRNNRRERMEEFPAKVVDKREGMITFELLKGQREFRVERDVYSRIRVGEFGTLFLKDGRFLSFEAGSIDGDSGDIYRKMVRR